MSMSVVSVSIGVQAQDDGDRPRGLNHVKETLVNPVRWGCKKVLLLRPDRPASLASSIDHSPLGPGCIFTCTAPSTPPLHLRSGVLTLSSSPVVDRGAPAPLLDWKADLVLGPHDCSPPSSSGIALGANENNDVTRSRTALQTMESQNAPALAMPYNDNNQAYSFEQELGGLTAMPAMPEEEEDNSMPTQTPRRPSPDNTMMEAASWFDTPLHVTDHGVPSNLRDNHEQLEPEIPLLPAQSNPVVNDPSASAMVESTPGDAMIIGDEQIGLDNETMSAILQDSQTQLSLDPEVPSTPSHMEPTTAAASPEHITEEAFAMLKFNDSHCYVRSTNLVIGRDMNFLAKYQQQKKEDKKKRVRAMQARRALDIYAREPSQPSLMGDDDPSGESLEGRPEPTGPLSVFSVFSEQGGPVAYNNPYSDDENEDHSKMRRRDRKNKSSSNTSVAPKSLMAFAEGENLQAENRYEADGTLTDPRQWAQLPVHPPIPADIKKISREHLLFHYDSNRGRWLLDVIGNGAIFNGVSYVKDTTDLELNHNDEIFIATLGMRFMLPESVVNESEPESEGEDEEALAAEASSISPARRLSNLFSEDDSSDDDDEPLAQVRAMAKPPVPKIKLKFKKKTLPTEEPASESEGVGGKGKGKGKGGKGKAAKSKDKSEKTEKVDKAEKAEKKSEKKAEKKPAKPEPKATPKEEPVTQPAEVAKPGETVRKPSDAARESAPVTAGPSTEQSPPVVPHVIDPTSVLANLAPDQLPEKRKGPGRPPKNGLLSKRDESGVKRKTKEFERRGVPVPALEALIAMVRQEQKAKDAANKAQARGEPIPDMPMPSIESSELMQDGERGRQQTPRESHNMESGSPGADRKLSPRLPRPIPREASPIKPMSEFTEEELKKPNMTYIYIIDEVLQNVEGGKADLQAIYDKIMKRWPFYKYKVGSLGWQSSVRHNLLSCDRFRDAGKSGKGKLWAINHDHPLDNKKRKPSPPPRPMQMPMQNGQMPMQGMSQNQFGQPHYNGQYQQPVNGQQGYKPGSGPYYSPYAAGGYPPPRQGSNGSFPPNAQPPHPLPPAPVNPFQPVVDAIIKYRIEYLGPASEDPDYKAREQAMNRGTEHFSSIYHGSGDATMTDAELDGVEPHMTLKSIFERHKYLFEKKPPAPAPAPATTQVPGGSSVQPAPQDPSAAGNASGSGAPPPTGLAPNQPGGLTAAPAQPAQPAPMALQNPVPTNGNSAPNTDIKMVDVGDSTTPTAGSVPGTQGQAPSNGTTASLPMPSAATSNPVPVDAPSAPPMSTVQPLGGSASVGDASVAAPDVKTQPGPSLPAAQLPAAPNAPQQLGTEVPVMAPAVAPAIPPAQQSTMAAADNTATAAPIVDSVPSTATMPTATPATPAPATVSSIAPTPTPAAVSTPPVVAAAPTATPAATTESQVPTAGAKRSADDAGNVSDEGDSKRAKLS